MENGRLLARFNKHGYTRTTIIANAPSAMFAIQTLPMDNKAVDLIKYVVVQI